MQFGPGSTVTLTPTSSPAGPPYSGVVDQQGNLVISGQVWQYQAGPPAFYRYQEPGNPPGNWHTLVFDAEGEYRRYLYDKVEGVAILVEYGTWSAVAA